VLLHNGGYDKDSEYGVDVDPADPDVPLVGGEIPIVLRPDQENGSVIGFRTRVLTKLDPFGTLTQPAQTGLHPVYQPASVFRVTRIGGYWSMLFSGKAYALARAQDGDNDLDGEIPSGDIVGIAERVDAGGGSLRDNQLRPKILVFYVNKKPVLRQDLGAFSPQVNQTYTRTATIDPLLNCNLIAFDIDPYNRNAPSRNVGGPVLPEVFQYAVQIIGPTTAGPDTVYQYLPNPTQPSQVFFNTPTVNFPIPRFFAPGNLTVRVTLCDCQSCSVDQGSGVCVSTDIPIRLVQTVADPPADLSSSRPGNTGSRTP
jgi:hypothetical protein